MTIPSWHCWRCEWIFLLVDCTKRRVIIKGLFIFGPHSLVSLVSLQKEENVVFSWVDFSNSVQLHKIHLAPAKYHTTINCCLFNNVKLTHACWHTYPDYSVHYTHEEIIGREKFRKNATWEWSLCVCWCYHKQKIVAWERFHQPKQRIHLSEYYVVPKDDLFRCPLQKGTSRNNEKWSNVSQDTYVLKMHCV